MHHTASATVAALAASCILSGALG